LEDILIKCKETFIVIGSGTQILPIDRLLTEAWFPESRERLINMIDKTQKNGVILISGDIHNAQILRTPCSSQSI
jgi:alkaline phosphatase D